MIFIETYVSLACVSVGLLYYAQFRYALQAGRQYYGYLFWVISAFMTASGIAVWLI